MLFCSSLSLSCSPVGFTGMGLLGMRVVEGKAKGNHLRGWNNAYMYKGCPFKIYNFQVLSSLLEITPSRRSENDRIISRR